MIYFAGIWRSDCGLCWCLTCWCRVSSSTAEVYYILLLITNMG